VSQRYRGTRPRPLRQGVGGEREGLIGEALRCLESDGLVGFPTETVWGLAARATSATALNRLRRWKGRPDQQPISILVPGPSVLADLGFETGPVARELMRRFWPGPLTLVMHCGAASRFGPGIVSGDGAVGLRCSPHPVAAQLSEEAYARGLGPITATSLNRSGLEPARTYRDAVAQSEVENPERVQILDPGACDAFGETPSTVLDLSGSKPRVIRSGAIPEHELAPFVAGGD